jgi:hypothetical protein
MALRHPADYEGAYLYGLVFEKFDDKDRLLTITKFFPGVIARGDFIRFLRYTPGFYKIINKIDPPYKMGER